MVYIKDTITTTASFPPFFPDICIDIIIMLFPCKNLTWWKSSTNTILETKINTNLSKTTQKTYQLQQ